MPGSVIDGVIQFFYDVYTVSPNDPAFNPDTDGLALGQLLEARASITVQSVPKPGSLDLMGGVLLGLGL